jgi:hypothetical protein
MIISSIASKISFAPQVTNSLIDSIAVHANVTSFSDSVLCIVFLCQTQNLEKLPEEALIAITGKE